MVTFLYEVICWATALISSVLPVFDEKWNHSHFQVSVKTENNGSYTDIHYDMQFSSVNVNEALVVIMGY